jgi:hypothetical protein
MLAGIQFRIFIFLSTTLRKLKIKIYKTIILFVLLYGCETWSHVKGTSQTDGVGEQNSEKNIWTQEGRNSMMLEETA